MRRMPLVLSLCVMIALASASLTAQSPPPGVPPDFVAPLEGIQEVPIRVTDATGIAQFTLLNGESMSYRLIVEDISNVVASHIHLGVPGMNGGVVVFLFGSVPPGGGPSHGTIASGVITEANFTGALAGQDFSVLLAAMRTEGAYVNVHTNDGIAPSDTGPGDFPGGEIRGVIKPARDQAGGQPTSSIVREDIVEP